MNPTPSQPLSVLRGGDCEHYKVTAMRAARVSRVAPSLRSIVVGFRITLTGRTPRV
jgi:hypothetical protein